MMLNYGQALTGIFDGILQCEGDTLFANKMVAELVYLEQWFEHDEEHGGIRLSKLRNGRTFETLWQKPGLI